MILDEHPAVRGSDIFEQKKLAQYAQMFHALVQGATDYGIFLLDPKGYVTAWNQGAMRIKGYSEREIVGQHFSRFYTPEAQSAGHPEDELQTALNEGKFVGDGWRVRRDGSRFWAAITIMPLRDDDGNLSGFSKIVRDITDRKQSTEFLIDSEDNLQRLAEALEERVSERTRELERAVADKTILLKEVHHRVKNNLQVVCSLLSMQIGCAEETSIVHALTAAQCRVQAMSLIHEQIYRTDRLADLNFGSYIEMLGDRLFKAYCVDPSLVTLMPGIERICLPVEDAVPCGLILNELLSNSLKHAFPDSRKGFVRVCFRSTDNEEVELEVADNGIGLPADFRLEDSRSLGMRIVGALIHQLRAKLNVASDGGTAIRLSWKVRPGKG